MRKVDTSYLDICEKWLNIDKNNKIILDPGAPPEVVEAFERSMRINKQLEEERRNRKRGPTAL
jgi:hypothetical protein